MLGYHAIVHSCRTIIPSVRRNTKFRLVTPPPKENGLLLTPHGFLHEQAEHVQSRLWLVKQSREKQFGGTNR